MKTLFCITIAHAALFLGPTSSRAAINCVQNPSFESGNFQGWTTTSAPSGSDYGVSASTSHSGSFEAYFAGLSPASYDMISQTLSTVPGTDYTIAFWLESVDGSANGLRMIFGGVTLFDRQNFMTPDAGHNAYTEYLFTGRATSAWTTLSFAGYNGPDSIFLDDVSVSQVPEPSTWTFLGLGIVGMAAFLYRAVSARRKAASVGSHEEI